MVIWGRQESAPDNGLDIAWDWFAPLVLLLPAVRPMLSLYPCRIGRGVFLACLFAFFSPSPQSAFLYFPGGAYRAQK